jgi:phosphatidylserine/phosphatidylglycerophosphate/cardiolipin synthase-like enzyme
MDENRLAVIIADFIQTTPPEIVQDVVVALADWDVAQSELNQAKLLATVHSPQAKSKLSKLLDCWRQDYPQVSPQALAISLQSTLMTIESARKPSVELVWTGPEINSSLRCTDQALLELINGAKHRLILVSFAVYKIQAIVDAIEEAIRRGVEVVICLEDVEESRGKIGYSTTKPFSSSIFRLAEFYRWPIEKRPHTQDDRFGSLHAKVAVADRAKVFISSANLTEYAMDMNIEIGVMIENTNIGEQIDNLITDLLIRGIFRKMSH